MCRRRLREGDQLPPPEKLSYGSRDVQTAMLGSFVQVCLLELDSPALWCFQFCYNMVCLCSAALTYPGSVWRLPL